MERTSSGTLLPTSVSVTVSQQGHSSRSSLMEHAAAAIPATLLLIIQLVTTLRQDALKGLISKESPVGKALMGKEVGDRVTIQASPTYSYDVVIRAIEKTGEDPDIPIGTF